MHAVNDTFPIAGLCLPKQPRGRIPRIVVAIHEPTEIRSELKQQPQRLAHCPRQMGDGSIDAQYEIEARYDSARIGKVLELLAEVHDVGSVPDQRQVGVSKLLLQADEGDAWKREQRFQRDQWDRAIARIRPTGPRKSDFAPAMAGKAC